MIGRRCLNLMELFDEVKNRYFQIIFRIVNECANGKAKKDILKIIDEGEFEQKVIGKNLQSFSGLVLNEYTQDENYNLIKHAKDIYYPAITCKDKNPLPIRFTNIEKAWLKALLEEPCIRMVLSEETHNKLSKELVDVDTPIRQEYFEMTNVIKLPEISECKGYEENFRILLKAIVEEKVIRYNNTDKYGNEYKSMRAIPVGIEFSMRDQRFRVSLYSLDNNRPIMANIFTMTDLTIEDDKPPFDRETAKKLLYEQRYCQEPVVLEVTDKKAAMERCFMCFSSMERTAKCLGDDKYEVKLNYYVFEEENLIRSIISLGPFVKVLSPARITDEIVRRVKLAIEINDV
jgi:predicted DNA-binding transcriptional regulator YafY